MRETHHFGPGWSVSDAVEFLAGLDSRLHLLTFCENCSAGEVTDEQCETAVQKYCDNEGCTIYYIECLEIQNSKLSSQVKELSDKFKRLF